MSNIEQTFEEWSAEDFLLSEIDRTPDVNERLVKLYDYFRVIGDYREEVEVED